MKKIKFFPFFFSDKKIWKSPPSYHLNWTFALILYNLLYLRTCDMLYKFDRRSYWLLSENRRDYVNAHRSDSLYLKNNLHNLTMHLFIFHVLHRNYSFFIVSEFVVCLLFSFSSAEMYIIWESHAICMLLIHGEDWINPYIKLLEFMHICFQTNK